ncbi:MFS general substrate transporter [Hortaea werneckii]|nr:MFS general substrate transporter [Hortaea werneckii]
MSQHTDAEEELLPGTIRLVTEDEEIKLVPEPTASPNDPLNWSPARKYWHAGLVLYITAFTAATSNDAGAGGEAMVKYLGISYGVQNTAAGVLFIAIGYWTLLGSPLTTLYGRRIMYLLCLIWCFIGSIWYANIETKQDAIWNQLFVGASESCAEAVAQLSLSELFYQHQRGTVLGLYILATSIGTFLGPLVAGYISSNSWRWIGWTAAIVTGATFIVFYFGLEETVFDRTVLVGSTGTRQLYSGKSEKVADPDASRLPIELQTAPKVESKQNSLEAALEVRDRPKTYWEQIRLITPAHNLVGTGFKQYLVRLWETVKIFYFPAVMFAGLQWGAQDAWLSFYLTVEEDNWYEAPWYYTDAEVAIMNIPTLIGAFIGCVYGGWFSDIFVRWYAKRYRGGMSEAEDRLWLLLPSALINPAGLMLFGITSAKGYNWPLPYVGLGFTGFGFGCAGDLGMAYLMDAYPEMVLEGMVGVAVINNSLACIFTFCVSLWIDASGLQDTFIAIGVLSFAIQLLKLPMIYWGKASRRWTADAYRRFLYIRDG